MPKHVMLAEDEPNIVESLRFLLDRAGFSVSVCDNGRAALDQVLSAPPDVLVLDVMLPELNGFEILRLMRADERGASVPVLILTAKGQREDKELALETGADLFISKPFANAELIAAVQSLANGRPGAAP